MTLYTRRGWRAAALGLMLAGCGIVAAFAWTRGYWGLLTGAGLAVLWLAGLAWWNAARPPAGGGSGQYASPSDPTDDRAVMQRLLLDAAPTPLLAIEGDTARALNRAARAIFATDDRIVPPPPALLDPAAKHLRHEGRQWRIDRIDASGGSSTSVAALIDFEREERVAEARASAELIEILGHELLNGLAPIVSLADSARAAKAPGLLREILELLARRAEGLQRFASGYRDLARLPEPAPAPVPLRRFADDQARTFAGRWPAIELVTEVFVDGAWPMDRDQIDRAVWALLHNAAEAASDAEQPRVGLSLARDARQLVIAVSDNGPGVPPESRAQVFRPFHTTKPEGSGIGLSLARQIAHAHGGTLELADTRPTTFRLTLPG
ncbi:ATP-binding protein [Pelagerythrobacter sp.]|uniref:sensor histidine kinase n=1 Tax=Pelagerythrobacter sp. TaxID=2800702 RepID=UPI0035B05AFE